MVFGIRERLPLFGTSVFVVLESLRRFFGGGSVFWLRLWCVGGFGGLTKVVLGSLRWFSGKGGAPFPFWNFWVGGFGRFYAFLG